MLIYAAILFIYQFGYWKFWDIFQNIFFRSFVKYPTIAMHSFIVLAILYLLAYRGGYFFKKCEKIKILLAGSLFPHALIDFFTHQNFAHEHFWPVSNVTFGLISDENSYFLGFDISFAVLAIIILLWKILNLTFKIKTA